MNGSLPTSRTHPPQAQAALKFAQTMEAEKLKNLLEQHVKRNQLYDRILQFLQNVWTALKKYSGGRLKFHPISNPNHQSKTKGYRL